METKSVSPGEFQLQYFEHGSGTEKLVLVHGYSASGRIWRLTQEALDPQVFKTIAISNKGAGDSDRAASEDGYSVESFAKDLYLTIDSLSLSDFTLVGHSMGGATVTQFALDHPDVIKRLVLLDPAPLGGRPLPDDWRQRVQAQFDGGPLSQSATLGTAKAPASFKAELEADVVRNPIERAMGSRHSMAGLKLRDRLGELRMPVLIVGGDNDDTVGVDNILTEYLGLPSESRHLHFYHGAGHSPNVEVPEEFAALLTRFITETTP